MAWTLPGALGIYAALTGFAISCVAYWYRRQNHKYFKPQKNGYVLITGASTGIGASAAIAVAKKGLRVFAGVRSQQDGIALKEVAGSIGENIVPVIIDVCKGETIEAALDVVKRTITPDCPLIGLVNNAGVQTEGPMECQPIDEVRWQYEVNVMGQIAVSQKFIPLLRQSKGRIINMSSLAGHISAPFLGAYAGTKHALEAITDAMRRELAPWGISVSVINPGFVATNILTKCYDKRTSMSSKYDESAQKLYKPFFEQKPIKDSLVVPPSHTDKAIVHALTNAYPKTKYWVGERNLVRLVRAALLLPSRYVDARTARVTWPKRFKVPPSGE